MDSGHPFVKLLGPLGHGPVSSAKLLGPSGPWSVLCQTSKLALAPCKTSRSLGPLPQPLWQTYCYTWVLTPALSNFLDHLVPGRHTAYLVPGPHSVKLLGLPDSRPTCSAKLLGPSLPWPCVLSNSKLTGSPAPEPQPLCQTYCCTWVVAPSLSNF
jgi:hypothetical protein